jgi:hypothetical protein
MSVHKSDALAEIIAIATRNGISAAEIASAFAHLQQPSAQAEESGSILKKIFSYIGAILIFSGLCAFVGMMWDDMGSIARITVTLGTGFFAFIMALACAADARYERATTPLYLVAALFQPAGIFVMLDEYSRGGDPRHGVLLMATFMILQQGLTFWKKQSTVLAFTTTFFTATFFATLMDVIDIPQDWTGIVISIAVLSAAQLMNKSRHAAIAPFWFFVSSIGLLWSTFDLVENTIFEIIYLGLTALLIFFSTLFRSRTLLLNGTIGMLCYIGYFTAEHFANNVGWPLVLILIGVAFLGLGSFALKLNNKYIAQKG